MNSVPGIEADAAVPHAPITGVLLDAGVHQRLMAQALTDLRSVLQATGGASGAGAGTRKEPAVQAVWRVRRPTQDSIIAQLGGAAAAGSGGEGDLETLAGYSQPGDSRAGGWADSGLCLDVREGDRSVSPLLQSSEPDWRALMNLEAACSDEVLLAHSQTFLAASGSMVAQVQAATAQLRAVSGLEHKQAGLESMEGVARLLDLVAARHLVDSAKVRRSGRWLIDKARVLSMRVLRAFREVVVDCLQRVASVPVLCSISDQSTT